MRISLLWVPRADNGKTGPIPTAYVGATREQTVASCQGCPLLPLSVRQDIDPSDAPPETPCYAWRGRPSMAHGSIRRASGERAPDPGERYSLLSAIRGRSPSARAVRFGAIGDPSRVGRRELAIAIGAWRRIGLSVLGYTHHWRTRAHAWLRSAFMASSDTLADADDAIDSGWVPATIVDPSDVERGIVTTPAGRKLVACPAQTRGVTCDACRLCSPRHDAWRAGKVHGIALIKH